MPAQSLVRRELFIHHPFEHSWSHASQGLWPTRRGACLLWFMLPPSQRQLPSLLLWLQYSISLSAFEFQSKPEADCKQMDGVIKIPQAGSTEAHGCKREAPLEECIPAPMLGFCLSGHLRTLRCEYTKQVLFTFSYLDSPWLSRLSTRPRFSRLPSVTSSPRPHTPHGATRLLSLLSSWGTNSPPPFMGVYYIHLGIAGNVSAYFISQHRS